MSSGPRLSQALALAETYAPGKVVNMLSVQGTQQVMLTVRFVEVERNVAKGLRFNVETHDLDLDRPFISTGDTIGGVLLDSFGLGQLRFRMGDVDYVGKLAGGRLNIERGDTRGADVIFSAEPAALVGVVYGGAPLETIGVEGDHSLARRFVTLFPLPPKAS